jgi:hypothetical protein
MYYMFNPVLLPRVKPDLAAFYVGVRQQLTVMTESVVYNAASLAYQARFIAEAQGTTSAVFQTVRCDSAVGVQGEIMVITESNGYNVVVLQRWNFSATLDINLVGIGVASIPACFQVVLVCGDDFAILEDGKAPERALYI